MLRFMDRAEVIAELLRDLDRELHTLERVNQMALDEATNAESKAENKYDTRSVEASYLAKGQGERILALKQLRAFFAVDRGPAPADSPAGIGRVCGLEGESGTRWVLLCPSGGGRTLSVAGKTVLVVTPGSPMGRALVGARVGDDVQVPTSRGPTELELVALS
jgi:hypothetical protein